VEAAWPLWIVAGVFTVLGLLVTADPEEARAFFARQARFLYGDGAHRRYERLPAALFRVMGVTMVVFGLVFGILASRG
jgi:hypothetical protein